MNYSSFLQEGLEDKKSWGYGFRRLNVKASDADRMICPYVFTGFGYKEQNGKLFLGLRMNVDQISPVKFMEWNGDDNVMEKFATMMGELVGKFIERNKNNNFKNQQ